MNERAVSLKDVVYTTKTLPANLDPEVEEFRCVNCGRFLGLIAVVEGTVCLKCKRCKIWSVIDVHQVTTEATDQEQVVDNTPAP